MPLEGLGLGQQTRTPIQQFSRTLSRGLKPLTGQDPFEEQDKRKLLEQAVRQKLVKGEISNGLELLRVPGVDAKTILPGFVKRMQKLGVNIPDSAASDLSSNDTLINLFSDDVQKGFVKRFGPKVAKELFAERLVCRDKVRCELVDKAIKEIKDVKKDALKREDKELQGLTPQVKELIKGSRQGSLGSKGELTIFEAMDIAQRRKLKFETQKAKVKAEAEVSAQAGITLGPQGAVAAGRLKQSVVDTAINRSALVDEVDNVIESIENNFGTDPSTAGTIRAILIQNNFLRTIADEIDTRTDINELQIPQGQKEAIFKQLLLVRNVRALLQDARISNFERKIGEELFGIGFQTVEDRLLRLKTLRNVSAKQQEKDLKFWPKNVNKEGLEIRILEDVSPLSAPSKPGLSDAAKKVIEKFKAR